MERAIAGLDLAAALKFAELAGYDVAALAMLLPMAEAGHMRAARKQQDS